MIFRYMDNVISIYCVAVLEIAWYFAFSSSVMDDNKDDVAFNTCQIHFPISCICVIGMLLNQKDKIIIIKKKQWKTGQLLRKKSVLFYKKDQLELKNDLSPSYQWIAKP